MPEQGSVGIVQTQYFTFAAPPNGMKLEGGAKLGPITLAYETYGELNAERSNAILLVHALSGDAHVAGKHSPDDRKTGWWDTMVGPGKAFDTEKYFVLCSNVLGGCMGSTGPSSINPATGRPYALEFPVVTIGDMVSAQRELVLHLGIEKLLCVAGGSMGGMQALDWATRFPDMVKSSMVISAGPLHDAQHIAFHAVGREAIRSDPRFNEGAYSKSSSPDSGLAIARMLAHITYLSDKSMRVKFGRKRRDTGALRYDLDKEFSVESYLDYQGEQFVNRFDANTYLYVSKALDYFDIAESYGSLDAAMARVQAKMLVLAFSSDWLYPPYQSEEIVYALTRQNKDVTYANIASDYGHDAFLLETTVMDKLISGFLRHVMNPSESNRCCDPSMEDGAPPEAAKSSIYKGQRIDYDLITERVQRGSRVLDIGCGNGVLLCRLKQEKDVQGMGLEVDQEAVVSAVASGVSVVQADIDKGLSALPDQCFDYVLLSMTLQVLKHPDLVLREMLRVGKKCIVSFPNFGLWRVRAGLVLNGRAPVTHNLPYAWHQSPNRHVLTIKDFREFCASLGIAIECEIPLTARGRTRFWPNMFAEEALYVLSAQ